MASPSPFPSALEDTAASALLLLAETNASSALLSSPRYDIDGEFLLKGKSSSDEENMSLVSSEGSKQSASSLTSDDGSSSEILCHKMRIVAVVARCHEMKLKVYVVRKSRSKVHRKFSAVKSPSLEKEVSAESVSTETGSSLSSSTSAGSSAQSCCVNKSECRQAVVPREEARKKTGGGGGSTHLQRQADAILKLLSSGGSSSEVKIRKVLGDSPDTSKALRMLLKLEEVKRSGSGGRQDPYIYTVA